MSIPKFTYQEVDGKKYVTQEQWVNDQNVHHREDGPAVTQWIVANGQLYVVEKQWYKNDKRHCETGPAEIHWANGTCEETWRQHGHIHRDGLLPAVEGKYFKWNVEYKVQTLYKYYRRIARFMLIIAARRQLKKKMTRRVLENMNAAFPYLEELIFAYV